MTFGFVDRRTAALASRLQRFCDQSVTDRCSSFRLKVELPYGPLGRDAQPSSARYPRTFLRSTPT